MRVKLIAIAVASLFASGSAWGEYESFVWDGLLEVGGRGVNTDGSAVNGAYGLWPTATVKPFSRLRRTRPRRRSTRTSTTA